MTIHNAAQHAIETHLAYCELILAAAAVMTAQEKMQLTEWENKNISAHGEPGTGDWPGWNAIINRISH